MLFMISFCTSSIPSAYGGGGGGGKIIGFRIYFVSWCLQRFSLLSPPPIPPSFTHPFAPPIPLRASVSL